MSVEWNGQVGAQSSGIDRGYSEPAERGNGLGSTEQTTYLAPPGSGGPVTLPGGGALFDASLAHDGPDLVLTLPGGDKIVVVDYFVQAEPPGLLTADGHLLPGDLVETLAGSVASGQYARIGE